MTKCNQMENLFASFFLNERDTEYAFSNLNKNALLKVVKGYKDYLKGKNTFPSPTYIEGIGIEGIGIESNDEKIIFSVENLYRLWSKSPYWLQRKKNGETLYVFGISFCEKLNSFIIGGYLENKKGEGRFVAIAWSQPVNTIGFLADAIIADYVPDGVRLKKNTPLYRLFTFACVS